MKISVYIGYDSRQDESKNYPDLVNPPYSVARYSILKNYKGDENDLSIQPIKLQDMIDGGLYWREKDTPIEFDPYGTLPVDRIDHKEALELSLIQKEPESSEIINSFPLSFMYFLRFFAIFSFVKSADLGKILL